MPHRLRKVLSSKPHQASLRLSSERALQSPRHRTGRPSNAVARPPRWSFAVDACFLSYRICCAGSGRASRPRRSADRRSPGDAPRSGLGDRLLQWTAGQETTARISLNNTNFPPQLNGRLVGKSRLFGDSSTIRRRSKLTRHCASAVVLTRFFRHFHAAIQVTLGVSSNQPDPAPNPSEGLTLTHCRVRYRVASRPEPQGPRSS